MRWGCRQTPSRSGTSPTFAHCRPLPRDDANCPPPDETTDRPGQATRPRMHIPAAGLVIGGGLAIADGCAWMHRPGGALSYENRRLRALRDNSKGAETALGVSAAFTMSPGLPTWFQWKYRDAPLCRRFYDASRTPSELMSLHRLRE